MSEYINAEAFRQDLYYSDDAVNMDGEYKGLWVRWRAIEVAIEKHKAENVAPVIPAKWIEFPVNRFSRCSNCGCEYTWDYTNVKNWNYCPTCGAKMDQE